MKKVWFIFSVLMFSTIGFATDQITIVINDGSSAPIVKNVSYDFDKPLGQLFPSKGKEVDDKTHKEYLHNGYTYDYIDYGWGRLVTMINRVRQDDVKKTGWNIFYCGVVVDESEIINGKEVILEYHYEWTKTSGIDATWLDEYQVISIVYPQTTRNNIEYCNLLEG